MKADRFLIGFILAYAIVCIIVFSSLDATISNSYQRAGAAAFIDHFVKEDFTLNPQEAKTRFIEGQEHYKVFSGLADWPPLQLILLTLSFLLLGANQFSFLLAPLLITLLALAYLYQFALHAYDRKAARLAVVLTAVSTFFFYQAAAPMLENGLALFTIMCLYHFTRYLQRKEPTQFYLSTAALGLGFLYKTQMVLILPVLAALFLWKTNLKRFFARNTTPRLLLVSLGILLLTLSPLIIREAVFMKEGISTFGERTVGRVETLYGEPASLPGWVTAMDFEFENELPEHKKQLIINRYHLTTPQTLVMVITSTFFNWALLPFILLGLFYQRKKWSMAEIGILLFFTVTLLFFTLYGGLPRYLLPTAILLIPFAARGISLLPKRAIVPATVIVLVVTAGQTAHFFAKIADNDHIQSMQHDYETAVEYILERTDGRFTVITSRVYQMSYQFIRHDQKKRAYVELIPERQAELERMLSGEFSVPEGLKGTSIPYSPERPPVAYVVVHERLETGPLAGTADYHIKKFLERHPTARLDATIDSPHPNSRTWIYAIEKHL